jgi:hypothetical protein
MDTILVERVGYRRLLGIPRGAPREAAIELPQGWYRVLSGAVKPGDYELDEELFWDTCVIFWRELTEFPDDPCYTASLFLCLIRAGEPVEALCPRCHRRPIRFGLRYCTACARNVIAALRRREQHLS